MSANPQKSWPMRVRRRTQSGQALVYGLFMLVAGLAATFFMFNVGQLIREKTKLVNTSDAVAYSAGVMHARALNFAAYTNRALVADEVAIAQMVSLASWGKYLVDHGNSALGLGCDPDIYYGIFNEPAAEGMMLYAPICLALGYGASFGINDYVSDAIQYIGQAVVLASEGSKWILQSAQAVMMISLYAARLKVMQDVASANYAGDGQVKVDAFPLLDSFYSSGGAGFIDGYDGERRTRMRDLVVGVVGKDGFTPKRAWSDQASVPEPSCLALGGYFNHVDRTGGTELIGFDQWKAADQASYYRWSLKEPKFGPPYCDDTSQRLGSGTQSATGDGSTSASSDDWEYSGIPSYLDLGEEALASPDPRARLAVRILRDNDQTLTSDARAQIKTTPRLNAYYSSAAAGTYAALSVSETFFRRPVPRSDGKKELGSLFNPYWQTHLVEVPEEVRAAAQGLQGGALP